VMLLVLPIRYALQSVSAVAASVRPALIAFVIATVAYGVATFFVDLYSPWLDFWAYAGIVLRIAVNAREAQHVVPAPAVVASSTPRTDNFGWIGAVRR
jgi:hypothetical protein